MRADAWEHVHVCVCGSGSGVRAHAFGGALSFCVFAVVQSFRPGRFHLLRFRFSHLLHFQRRRLPDASFVGEEFFFIYFVFIFFATGILVLLSGLFVALSFALSLLTRGQGVLARTLFLPGKALFRGREEGSSL